MKRCLSERRLAWLVAGGGSEADRAHVGSCLQCASRKRAIDRDLAAVSTILRAAPSAESETIAARLWRSRLLRTAFAPAAAFAAAATIALWISGVRPPISVPGRTARFTSVDAAETRDAASELAAALFDLGDGRSATIDEPVPAYVYASAAIGGGWPCSDANGLGSDCDGR